MPNPRCRTETSGVISIVLSGNSTGWPISPIEISRDFPLYGYMDNTLLQALFGCSHRKTTFPLTPRQGGRSGEPRTVQSKAQTYIACLDCGKELPYDWEKMQTVKPSPLTRLMPVLRRTAA